MSTAKHVTNIYDPESPSARTRYSLRSRSQTWEEYYECTRGFSIGPPKATQTLTSAQLQGKGMVGLYR